MRTVEIYDTTLRDGSQAEGVSFSVEDKLRIVQELDEFGIPYIEGGYPGSNPKDIEFFKRVKDLKLKSALVVPFGSTRRAGNPPDRDVGLKALLDTGLPVITIFGKSWKLHATKVLRVSPEENLVLIEDSVRYLVGKGRKVIYDAEHFYDGYKDDPEYALETLRAARRGGAFRLVLCDTNGGSLPGEIKAITERVAEEFDVPLGIHTHNDAGMAVANSIVAVEAGAMHVQGTINGYGERCGNANLCVVIPNLQLKMGIKCVPDESLRRLTALSILISELANLAHDDRQPYVGRSAFAHKGGMHIDAVRKITRSFEHIEPELVGNRRRVLISEQAGKSAILMKVEDEFPNLDKNSPEAQELFRKLKEAEKEGYQYEAAEASFKLLANKVLGRYRPLFEVLGFRIITDSFPVDGEHMIRSEATIKVREPNGKIEHTAAEGDGPVNALDTALRKALETFYPELRSVHLTDFKVRVLDSQAGTAAKVRVLIESSDGEENWGTIGVSENIIKASWDALVDSLEYKLFKSKRA
jgi:2-isopropylmalate synthase